MLIDTVEQLVEFAELQDIQCFEERGRRVSWTDDERASRSFPEIDSSMGIEIGPHRVNYRVRMLYTDVEAEYIADWVAVVTIPDEHTVSADAAHEYGDRVAFFAVYPYIRASIYGSASRLNQPVPVLGVVRQGQFERGDRLSQDEARSRFEDNRSERSAS
ncbi:hypothetical protein NYQ31_11835 [Curtobacterium flaccumfaciens]|uniref:hypothetical protein n=1 Tax=Curtobacterium flaccumfaciens TaxID=2035 RepID=UPI00217D8AC2|nr:hypothetical protein [Curtobacterium flaccumfaciens]MCS6559090.1 hypothetical protein [Curtobacterium flaccumfaciens]